MKKILLLFLLIFSVTTQAQTYPVNPTKFGKIALKTNGVSTSTTKINTQESDGQINYIDAVNLPVPTSVVNALDIKIENSAGAIQGFALTNNGNGTVNIASGTAYLRATNNQYAPLVKYTIPAVTNLALTDNANNFVLVDYNGGVPALTVTTNSASINIETNSIALVVSRVGNTLDYLSLVGQNVDANAKLRVRFLNQEGIRRLNGASIGFSARNLTLTSGVLASGLIKINTPAFNTNTPDTFTQVYNNGAVWTRTTGQTQVNNTQYNNAGTLTNLGNNDYRTDYIYLLPNNPSKLYLVLGTTSYANITAARGALQPATLPSELQTLGVLVGRSIIQRLGANISEVSSAFDVVFPNSPVPEHNALAGLQGGAANDYQHLTTAEKASFALDANVLHKTLDESKSGRLSVSANSSSPTLSGASVTGVGVYGSSTSGTGVFANSASGIGLNVTNSAGNVSDIAQFSTQGGSTAKIDYLANVIGKSFIKTGGTATQALLADGGILNNPISGTGAGLNSQVAFFTGSNSVSGNNGLRWDDTNKQLIINASSAGIKDVLSILNSHNQIGIMNGVRVYFRDFLLESLSTYGSSDGKLLIGTASSTFLTLLQNGNLGLGKTPTEVLDVAGRIKSDALAGTGIRMTLSQSDGTQIAGDVAPTSGTYTPTLTNVSNVTGLTVQKAYYTRIGNIVNVSVGFQFNITATSVNSRFTISLPVNRATNSAYNFGNGSVVTSNTPNELYPCILTSGSTSNITVYFVPAVTSTTYSGSVTFQYSVLD